MMKKLTNYFTILKMMMLIIPVPVIWVTILFIIYGDESIGKTVGIIALLFLMISPYIAFFSLKNINYTTYFGEGKIVQKFFGKKKEIRIDEIKVVFVYGYNIYLLRDNINYDFSESGRILRKKMSNEVVFQLGQSNDILFFLCSNKYEIHYKKPFLVKNRVEKYLKN